MSRPLKLNAADLETLRRLVASGMSDRGIGGILRCSAATVRRSRMRLDIPASHRVVGGPSQLQTDHHFFAEIDTPEKAYVLGFLIADGHIYKTGNRVELGVKEADAAILRAIATAMGNSESLRVTFNSYDRSRFIRITLGSTQMADDLARLGLRNDKSKTAVFPQLPADLEGHLVRGIWDGDGSIGKYQFELIGTSALLDGVVAAAERHTGCVLRRRMSGKDNRYHYAYGTRRDTAILHWIYSGAGIALERKREKFLTYWSEVPSVESLNLRLGPRVYTRKSQGRSAADHPSGPSRG